MTKAKAKKSPPAKGKATPKGKAKGGKKPKLRNMKVEEVLALFSEKERHHIGKVQTTVKNLARLLANKFCKVRKEDMREFLWYAGAQIMKHPNRGAYEIYKRWRNIAAGYRTYLVCQKGAERIPFPDDGELATNVLAAAEADAFCRIAERYVDVEG